MSAIGMRLEGAVPLDRNLQIGLRLEGVSLGHDHRGMPEQLTHRVDVHSAPKQPTGERVSQIVNV